MNNILANETLFRIGIFSFIVMVIADVIVAWALYIFLKPINNEFSLLAAWLRLVNSAIFAIALYNLFSVLHILSSADYLDRIQHKSVAGTGYDFARCI